MHRAVGGPPPKPVRLVPVRAEGLPDVAEVIVHADRLEVNSAGCWLTVPFVGIARWPRPVGLWRRLYRWGWHPGWLPVAEKEWHHAPGESLLRFRTDPVLSLYLAAGEPEEYHASAYRRAQEVMGAGGFHCWDLG